MTLNRWQVRILHRAPMIFIYLLILFLCLFIVSAVALFFIFEIISIFTTDAPFVPIPEDIEEKIIENLKLDDRSVLYDLGCGDGRILQKALEKYPGIRAVGIDVAFVPYFLAKFRTRKNKNIEIRRENIFTAEVSDATHIFIYLFPAASEKLLPILEKKVRGGTRVVSCDFEDKNRKADEIITLGENTAGRGKRLIVYTL